MSRLKAKAIVWSLASLAHLPFNFAQKIGKFIGWINWKFHTRSALVTRINLALCFPTMRAQQRQELARSSLLQTGQMLMETPCVWLGDRQKNRERILACHGEELLLKAMAEGKGVVIILPHLGNWELLNVFYEYPLPLIGLYNPPDDPLLDEYLDFVRNRFGNRVVPTTRAGLASLYKALKKGWVVTVLPDQVPGTGKFVPFFDVPVLTDPLIPRMIRNTGARAVCLSILRTEKSGHFTVEISEPDQDIYSEDLITSLTGMNRTIERAVLSAPEQYQWEYKRFRRQPAGYANPYSNR